MQKTPSTQSGFSIVRVLAAFILCAVGGGLALLSFAANPPAGTITPTSAPITWEGTAPGGVPAPGEESCVEGVNCDTFKLTLSGTPADWAGKGAKVRIQWLTPGSDYDLVIHKGAPNGPVVASSGAGTSVFEEALLNPSSASVGTGEFFVRVVYFAVTPGDQYGGEVSVVSVANPPPAPQATGVAPRYQVHTPPAAGAATLGIDAAEPSIGVNWLSEGLVTPGSSFVPTDENGGRSMYIALLQTLRVTFEDSCPSSPGALWEDRSFVTTTAQTFDPILFTDHGYPGGTGTGRSLVSQLIFPAGSVGSASGHTGGPSNPTADGGDVPPPGNSAAWTSSTGAGPGSGIDHQSIGGGGPFHAPFVPAPGAYPNPIYYCGQLPTKTCALSIDGGTTYGPAVATDPGSQCTGLHGHLKVGPDGSAYLPVKGCGISQGVVASETNGATWSVRVVPNSIASSSDPAVGIGRGDKTEGVGRLYFGYASGDSGAAVAFSDDRGVTWSSPVDVGAKFGINNVVFPAVVAGDDDRAAFAFYGTPTAGPLQGPKFSGIWHLYVAHTYDGGQTWETVDVTPNDPMQRGCIWLQGGANICRNMLDFAGIDVDKRGRVLIAYNDGCAGAECSQTPDTAVGNSYTALAAIGRQVAGKGLFAQFDNTPLSDADTAPGAPYVTALRNSGVVNLAWSVSNDGGSPITGYTVSRTGGAAFAPVNVEATQVRYVDATATDPSVTYTYTVAATNAVGTSCGNNAVAARFVGNSSTAAGYTIADDPAGDQKNAPADPDLDVDSLAIHEPSTGPHAGKLVFQMKLSAPPSGNNKKWRIIWDSPNAFGTEQDEEGNDVQVHHGQFYVGMLTNDAGQLSFDYGTVKTAVVGLAVGVPETIPVGAPDAGSVDATGLATIVVSKDKVGNLQTGDLMGNFSVRTYRTPESNFVRSTDAIDLTTNATANDFTANAFTYAVVGPVPGLLDVVSRKTHGAAGPFDVDLPLFEPRGIEPRTGGTGGDHQIVATFAGPASFASAAVTSGTGSIPPGGATASGNQITMNLTGVSNAQTIEITIFGANGGSGTSDIKFPVGFLLGDTSNDGVVNVADITETRRASGQVPAPGSFRTDVTVDGVTNSADITVVRRQSGTPMRQRSN